MEARVDEKSAIINAHVDALLAKITSPQQAKIMADFVALAKEQEKRYTLSVDFKRIEAECEKYLALLVILNSAKTELACYRLDAPPLIDLYMPFMLTNQTALMELGYELAEKQGEAHQNSHLLQYCAIAADADHFNKMCDRLGLVKNGQAYKHFLIQSNPALRLPLAPLYLAAFHGNHNLLHEMCTRLDRVALTELDENSGLSLMHFAAMGGDVHTIDYLYNVQCLSFDIPSRFHISPFAYTALSNQPAAVAAFIDHGYRPSAQDLVDFNTLYLNNAITELRQRASQLDQLHDMPHVLREAMGDPSLRAVKAARLAIDAQLASTLEMLTDIINAARYNPAEWEVTSLVARDAADNLRQEICSYLHLTDHDSQFGRYIQHALEQVDENVRLIDRAQTSSPYSRAPQPSSLASSSASLFHQTKRGDDLDMLNLTIKDFQPEEVELHDFVSEKRVDEEKEEKEFKPT